MGSNTGGGNDSVSDCLWRQHKEKIAMRLLPVHRMRLPPYRMRARTILDSTGSATSLVQDNRVLQIPDDKLPYLL